MDKILKLTIVLTCEGPKLESEPLYPWIKLLCQPIALTQGVKNQGFVWGISPYEKLWDHLDNRKKHDLKSKK